MAELSSNKLIAKNTIMLYIRMFLGMIVGLYTSRVVLQTLGVEDYGINGVVGGVVSMFSFLNAAMSGATSRFLSYEMGRENKDRLNEIFSSALIVHFGIGLIVAVLSETIGLWFLYNKLVIPSSRMTAAFWVVQFSIARMLLSVTQVPYNATIIAHEKMDVYAYVELLHVFLKLGIVYLLQIGNFDKLIFYAFLGLIVSLIVRMSYRIYCVSHFSESNFRWVWNKDILIGLTSFSGYNLLGNFGRICNNQGITFLINIFHGVTMNAAAGVANSISGIVNGFVANIVTAFRPSITKAYAKNDIFKMEDLFSLALKIVVIVHSIVVVPLIIEAPTVMRVWLGQVPEHSVSFCRLILVTIYFETIRYILVIGIHAVGKVKNMSIVTGLGYCMNPVFIYLLFFMGFSVEIAYIGNILLNIFLITWVSFLLYRYIPSLRITKILSSTVHPFLVAGSVFFMLLTISRHFTPGVYRIVTSVLVSIVAITVLSYVFCLNSNQRQQVKLTIKNKMKNYG